MHLKKKIKDGFKMYRYNGKKMGNPSIEYKCVFKTTQNNTVFKST